MDGLLRRTHVKKMTISLLSVCLFFVGTVGLSAYLLFAKDRTVNPPIHGYTATLEVVDLNDPQKSCTDVTYSDLTTGYSRDDTDCAGKRRIYIFHGSSELTVLDPESKTYWKGKPATHLSVHARPKDSSHKRYQNVDGYLFELKQCASHRLFDDAVRCFDWSYLGSGVGFGHEYEPGKLFRVKRFSAGTPNASSFTVPGDYKEVPMPANASSSR
jgi:hypothetical protein